MHLRDVNGKEVSITVDVDDTTRELLAGENPPPGVLGPHMVLTPGDEPHIQGCSPDGWGRLTFLRDGPAKEGRRVSPPERLEEEKQGSRRASSISK
jgi:hypothetical protein